MKLLNITKIVGISAISVIMAGCGGGSSDSSPGTGGNTPTPEPLLNIIPTADAGPDKYVEVARSIMISGTGLDTDGTIVSYEWTKDSNVLATTDSFEYIATTVGTDTLTLTVMDDDGATASDTMDVIVSEAPPVNTVPVADAGDNQDVSVSATVSLNSNRSSDPEDDSLNFYWSIINQPAGSNAVLSNRTAVNPTFVADEAGSYEIKLTVNDGELSDSDTVVVNATLADGIYLYSGSHSIDLPSICDGVTCVKRVNGVYAGITTVTHGTYKLVAVGQDYTVDNLVAVDINSVTWARISGLSDGQVIRAGSEIEFAFISGLTNNQQAKLQWSLDINGNQAILETIYFTSN